MTDEIVRTNDAISDFDGSRNLSGRPSAIFLVTALAGWSVVILFALGESLDFMWQAGESGSPPAQWPAEISSVQISNKPLVLVFLHPKCPCSRATLDELAIAMSRTRDQLQYFAVFEQPPGRNDDWTKDSLWKKAEGMPGLSRVVDVDGKLVNAFHVKTSGDTVVYSAEGHLLFHGGLTAARDHRGVNAGRTFLESWSEGSWSKKLPGKMMTSPVFGCPLCAAPSLVSSTPQEEKHRDAP